MQHHTPQTYGRELWGTHALALLLAIAGGILAGIVIYSKFQPLIDAFNRR